MTTYQAAADSSGAQLAHVSYWRADGRIYWGHIRRLDSEYVFEGRWRIGNDRHTSFPDEELKTISIGNREEAVRFIEQILPYYGCPTRELSEAIDWVASWI